ncbi:MAG: phenylalanine--tRNA ligase subunit beta [Acidimicrobiia bacterium]|nr:phenylalanine--tRNA ligase subunit beta [Acidimicrobiia bacterium]MYB72951.1 phenylalanine--tRNA ligase subunit beta [Acidimicrobiia bacterium]MYH97164.1 phenylalanine--tRNA ligase subunit beta [Acidimicrobiia bacterium]MYI00831.1 phenylalanine--tRNA ligase subunit beta [Acidimicrobiia bacterium]
MKVLLSWLREFAPDIEGEPEHLAGVLSDLGLAVEELSHVGQGLDGIVVAEVLSTRPHPDADRIHLVDVDAGDGEALQVCCGAFNMAVGDLVPLATVGTTMPGGMEIARRKMRGEWSNGMLCSGAEIGMGDDHEGILILDQGLSLGAPLTEALGIHPDVLFDLEVNPNRPDAMSVMGVARDLAARLGVAFAVTAPGVEEAGQPAAERAAVSIAAPDFCRRFGVRVLDNVPSGPSPRWMANRLLAVGQRPINAVVDLSNYVMFELGQPNHTYDLDLVPEGELGVRMAHKGEQLTTLDGVERTLTSYDGVIVNRDDEAIGLAGVMGGASTEISAGTRSVLLEAAWWDPMTIARTARRLGLRSEASARFERGADPEIIPMALDRFVELAAALGATTSPGMIDATGNRPAPITVRVRTPRVNAILGTELSTDEMTALLEPIGFACEAGGDSQDFKVSIPSWRIDSATEIDVIEEVGRLHGYSNIARTVPVTEQAGTLTPQQQDRRHIRALLTGMGITEAMPLPFLAPGDLARAGLGDDGITVTNPLVAEESIMRTSLRPGLLKAVAYNAARRTTGVSLFEIGRTNPGGGGELPDEHEHLAVILAGQEATAATTLWRRLARHLAATNPGVVNGPVDGLHPGRSGQVLADGQPVGALGEIDPQVLDAYEIDERVAWLEVDLGALLEADRGLAPYRAPSRYPSSDIDLAFTVPDEVSADEVAATIAQAGGELLASVSLFDVFRSEQLGEGRRSLAYTLRFEAADRTLNDAEVAAARQTCIDAVTTTHNATLRG